MRLEDIINVDELRETIRKNSTIEPLNEAYVVESPKTSIGTESLSQKSKKILQTKLDTYSAELNHVSAQLDSVTRDVAMPDASAYSSLKAQEGRLLQLSFFLGLHATNIGDPQSSLAMDSLTYMRLERDWGTFDSWQKDFIACALTACNFAVTAYSYDLRRYINLVVDSMHALPPNVTPVISLAVMPELYVRDYLDDRKSYVFAMIRELDWAKIDSRVKRAERAAAAYEGREQ
jgi:superoxide dismutase